MKLIETENIKVVASDGYNYIFNKHNGQFARWGVTKEDDPQLAPFGPEILDLEISIGDCSGGRDENGKGGCVWCYKSNSIDNGYHMSLDTFQQIVDKMPSTLTQIALGLTDISANKDLIPILQHARQKGIVPNFTLAGYGLTDELVEECSKYIGAVAVSVYPHNRNMAYDTVRKFLDAGVQQTNIHLLYHSRNESHVRNTLVDVLEDPRLENLNAVVLLALKPKGRAENRLRPMSYDKFSSIVGWCVDKGVPLGFDSCSASNAQRFANENGLDQWSQYIEPCESALMSSYINVHGDFFPCSFMEGEGDWNTGISVLSANDFLEEVWYHPRVKEWRMRLNSSCRSCPQWDL